MSIGREVVSEWTASFPDPLIVGPGNRLRIGDRDGTWPDFYWCTTASGRSGWIPRQVLEIQSKSDAVVSRAYDACELTVKAGDFVVTYESLAGWTWCESDDGRSGWVPNRCLKTL